MKRRGQGAFPGKEREEARLPSGADGLLVDGQQRIPTNRRQDAMHAKSYCEGGDVFTDPDKFRSLLLNSFTDESQAAREYRAKLNELQPSDPAALLEYLRETLGGKLAYKRIELVRAAAESWLDKHG